MQKYIYTLLFLIISGFLVASDFSSVILSENDFSGPIKRRDTLKTDTMFVARRMGNEVKFTLNKAGELGILLDETQMITMKKDGFTGFGTKNPQYRLDVCGTIRASEELIVESSEWCDFVFDDQYKLQPFEQRISAIRKNKHLPYLKPEAEIYENGIPVSETLNGLLRNIEEMYLYIEELENRITALELENKNLKSAQE